ncbi:MAG TPA: hypothetical protein VIK32_05070 [Candidatus Limnocylindrales bacterium]
MRVRRFLAMIAAGFLGAAVLLVVANALGFVGGDQTTTGAVKGAYIAFKSAGLTPQQIYEQHAGSVVEIQTTFPGTYDIFGQSTGGGAGSGHRLRGIQGRIHPHQRARGERERPSRQHGYSDLQG